MEAIKHTAKVALLTLAGLSSNFSHADAIGEFSEPWRDKSTAIVIDPYEKNEINWDELAKDKRVVAIIHRATHGMKVDNKYIERRAEAKKRGYLWGSYHLGKPGDPIAQAEQYLKVVGDNQDDLMALDLEEISSNFMSLKDANIFMKHVGEKTKRLPVVYANHNVAESISKSPNAAPLLLQTPLWYARFRKSIPNFPKQGWKTYTLWQFSSEINCKLGVTCLYRAPGTKMDMDINVFYGSVASLKEKWPLTPKYNHRASNERSVDLSQAATEPSKYAGDRPCP